MESRLALGFSGIKSSSALVAKIQGGMNLHQFDNFKVPSESAFIT